MHCLRPSYNEDFIYAPSYNPASCFRWMLVLNLELEKPISNHLTYLGTGWFPCLRSGDSHIYLTGPYSAPSDVSESLRPLGLQRARLLYPWDFPDNNARMGFHCLRSGIVLTQGSNRRLLSCRRILNPEPSGNSSLKTFRLEKSPWLGSCPAHVEQADLVPFCLQMT